MYQSPLRYPGGKTRSRVILYNILVDYFDVVSVKTILSPYLGGGSFEFYLTERLGVNVIGNDKFAPLWQFWNECIFNRDALCNKVVNIRQTMVDSEDNGKGKFASLRNNIMLMNDSIEKAAAYFTINRCSFSGATLSGGFSSESMKTRFTQSSIDRLKNLSTSNLVVENLDGVQFIEKHWTENDDTTVMFIDPPYYLGKGSKLYGNKGDMHKEFSHEDLFESLKNKKRWIVTYNDDEYIRGLYKDFIIIDASWAYGMNKSKKSSEIIIVSQ